MPTHLKLGFGFFIILLSLITGCAPKADDMLFPRLEWVGKPALHQIRSTKLREKMRDLRVLMYEDVYDELLFDKQRARQAIAIADIAGSMAEVAMDILAVRRELDLDADHARVFQAHAQRLKDQAMALREAARQEQSDVYPSMIRDMVKTCNSCHRKFRRM